MPVYLFVCLFVCPLVCPSHFPFLDSLFHSVVRRREPSSKSHCYLLPPPPPPPLLRGQLVERCPLLFYSQNFSLNGGSFDLGSTSLSPLAQTNTHTIKPDEKAQNILRLTVGLLNYRITSITIRGAVAATTKPWFLQWITLLCCFLVPFRFEFARARNACMRTLLKVPQIVR